MVKGVSRQVIVVHSPDKKLFDQAIFILSDDAVGRDSITDEALLKEARHIIRGPYHRKKQNLYLAGPIWACGGALLTALLWLVTTIL